MPEEDERKSNDDDVPCSDKRLQRNPIGYDCRDSGLTTQEMIAPIIE